MADPTTFVPSYSYSGWQAANPSDPLPAQHVDNDMANLQRSIDELVAAVKDVRRDDGALQNGSVTNESLSADIASTIIGAVTTLAEGYRDQAAASAGTATTKAGEATGAAAAALASQQAADAAKVYVQGVEASLPEWKGGWVTATAYGLGDLARQNGTTYICTIAHTSGTFATDLTASRWAIFAEKGSAGAGTGDLLAANNLSDIASPALALSNLNGQPKDTDLTAIAALTSAANKMPYATGAGTWGLANLTAFARTLLDDADQATAQATLGVAGNMVLPGTVIFYAASAAPAGYLKANGALVSRTTYAALFSAIGTAHGAGDGTTTFNLPDLRGEFIRGWDDARGLDSGRTFGSVQTDAFQAHWHQMTSTWTGGSGGSGDGTGANGAAGETIRNDRAREPIASWGGTPRQAAETRPRNIALLACIKY